MVLHIVLIWIMGFGALSLTLFELWGKFGLSESKLRCDIIIKNGHSPKMFYFVLSIVLPVVIMIFCYSMIFFKIRQGFFNYFLVEKLKIAINFIPSWYNYINKWEGSSNLYFYLIIGSNYILLIWYWSKLRNWYYYKCYMEIFKIGMFCLDTKQF